MKKAVKRITRKTLSVLLAAALILSCLTVSFSVFAASETFSVPSSSPAIPLYVGKAVALKDLYVQVGDSFATGDTVSWGLPDNDSVQLDTTNGYLIGKKAGKAKITVTSGSATQNVWVLVNAQGNDNFAVYYADFNDESTYDASDWIAFALAQNSPANIYNSGNGTKNGQASVASVNTTSGARKGLFFGSIGDGSGTKGGVLVSEILKDFGDYSVETTIAAVRSAASTDVAIGAAGMLVRATLRDGIKTASGTPTVLDSTKKSIHLRFRQYGGLAISAYSASDTKSVTGARYIGSDQGATLFTGEITADDLWSKSGVSGTTNNKVMYPDPNGTAQLRERAVKVDLRGKGIRYSIDNNVIFDTIANNEIKGMIAPVDTAPTGTYAATYPNGYTVMDSISHSDYENLYDEKIQAEKGTIGFSMNAGANYYYLDVKVTPANVNVNEDIMPKMIKESDIGTDEPETPEEPEEPDPTLLPSVDGKYRVTAKSPAVPLYAGKYINVADLSVEVGGSAVAGDALTWSAIANSGDAAVLDNNNTQIKGVKAGIAGFTVSDGNNTQNVWVTVNAKGDNDFALINIDFSKNNFNASDWIEGSCNVSASNVGYPSGNYAYNHGQGDPMQPAEAALLTGKLFKTTGIASKVQVNAGGTTKGALYIGAAQNYGGVKAIVYNNPMMADFYDYSMEANMSNKMTTEGSENMIAAPGLLLRTDADYTAQTDEFIITSTNKSLALRFRNYGGVSIFGLSNVDKLEAKSPYESIPIWRQAPYTFYTVGTKSDYFMCNDKSKVFYPDASDASSLTVKNVKVQLSGIGIKYALNDNVIFDTVSSVSSYNAYQMKLADGAATTDLASANTCEPIPSGANYTAMYNQNIKAQKGTVGFINNYGNDLYVYDVKVIPSNFEIASQAGKVPKMSNAGVNGYAVAVNTKLDLTALGATNVADQKTADYEIIDGTLLVYAVPSTPTVTFGGITVTFVAAGEEACEEATPFADKNMSLVSNGNNEFTLTVTGDKEIIPGTLKINDEVLYGGEDNNGKSYTFTVLDPKSFTVTADFETTEENLGNLAVMGSSIREPHGAKQATEAIRFTSRIAAVRRDGQNIDFVSPAGYTYLAVGTFIIPTALLGGKALRVPDELIATYDPYTEDTLTIGKYKAKNVPIEVLERATAQYSDAFVHMDYGVVTKEGIDMNLLDQDMTAVSYIQYQKNGEIGYIYSGSISKSYQDVHSEALPISNADEDLKEAIVGTRYYVSGGKTTFALKINGAYGFNWAIKDKDGETVTSGAEESVEGTHVFAKTVNTDEAGLKFTATLLDQYGVEVSYNAGNDAEFEFDCKTADITNVEEPTEPEEPEEPEEPTTPTEANLNNTYLKLSNKQPITVGFIGGSVTYGQGASNAEATSWRGLLTTWFNTEYGVTVTPLKEGVGGSSSVWGAPRFEKDILNNNPDLIFIDCSINDKYIGENIGSTGKPKERESAALMDYMIRRAAVKCPNADIIVITVPDGDTVTNGNPNADAHKKVAAYEKVNYIDLTPVGQEIKSAGTWSTYYKDNVHPLDAGYTKYAEYIENAIVAKFAESAQAAPTAAVDHTVQANPYNYGESNYCTVPTQYQIDSSDSASITAQSGWTDQYFKGAGIGNCGSYSKFNNYYGLKGTGGETMTYYFTGTSVHLLGNFAKGTNIEIVLDGDKNGKKTIAVNKEAGEVYLWDNLPTNTRHKIELTVNGTGNAYFCCFAVGKTADTIALDLSDVTGGGGEPEQPEQPTDNYVDPGTFSSSSTNIDSLFGTVGGVRQVGTDHDLDNSSATTPFSYGLNENITFVVRTHSDYKIKYSLCKDDPANNVISGETSTTNPDTPVKSGTAVGSLELTTQMKKAGAARLNIEIQDASGNTIKYNGSQSVKFDITAVADYQNLKQALEISGNKPASIIETLRNDYLTRAEITNYTLANYYEVSKTGNPIITYLTTTNTVASDYTKFNGNADLANRISLKLSKIDDNYRYFDFIIAVDDTVGCTTTNANGLFDNNSTNYNKRPATGSIVIPRNGTITKVKAYYQGHGVEPGRYINGAANTLVINMNSHGYDNAKAVASNTYINTLNETEMASGGVKNFLRNTEEGTYTNYNDSYAYGILYRDYIALQAGKRLAKLLNGGSALNDITVTGRSMGGWQAIMMTALDKSITCTDVLYPWMCSVYDKDTKLMPSVFNVKYVSGKAAKYYSSVSAAEYIVSTMNNRPASYTISIMGGMSDTTSPVSGVMALYNAFKTANCNKVLTMKQFEGHGNSGFQGFSQAMRYETTITANYNSSSNTHSYNGSDEPEDIAHSEINPAVIPDDAAYDPRTTKTTKTYYTDSTCQTTASAPTAAYLPVKSGANFPAFSSSSTNLAALIENGNVGTDHDLTSHNDATRNAISYGLNEDIKFTVDVVGDYIIYYELFKDNAVVNAIPSLGEVVAYNNKSKAANDVDTTLYVNNNAPVKVGRARGKLELTTQMKQAGTVRLTCFIEKENGERVQYSKGDAVFNIVAAADYTNIKSVLVSSGAKPADQDTFINNLKSAVETQANTVGASMDSSVKSFIEGAAVGDTKTFGSVLKLECSKSASGVKAFYYTIATDSSVGLSYTSSDYTKRPATGVIHVPTTFSSITGVEGYYTSWSKAADGGKTDVSSTISGITYVHNSNTNPIVVYTYPNGGNPKGGSAGTAGIADANQDNITDPTKTYEYGMIFRDYLALLITKRIYNYVKEAASPTAKIAKVAVTGTSQGGFQAWWVNALDYEVNSNKTDVAWMASVGQENSNYILSGFSPYGTGHNYFNTVSAAEYIAKTKDSRPSNYAFKLTGSMGDTTSPISGIIAIWNAFKNFTCKKELALPQYKFHNDNPLGDVWINVHLQIAATP